MYDDEIWTLEDMPADKIEAAKPSFDQLRAAYAEGFLNHLADLEIGKLLGSAQLRGMQTTIVR